MNNRIKDLWIEALQSGKYTQGRGYLNSGDKFCCLGVLCELAVKEGVCEKTTSGGLSSYGSHLGTPPESVMRWLGLYSTYVLVGMNDSRNKSFDEIALWIKNNL